MRPDQHKKKKSSQYKKKHGIPNSNSDKTENSRQKGQNSQISSGSKDLRDKKEVQLEQRKNLEDEVPEEDDSTWGFSKRKVESNWEKYEISSEEEDLGTDFGVLLSFAGSSSGHKKLETEQEQEGSLNNFSSLTIDCKKLADSLRNMKLLEKYKLDTLTNDTDILDYVTTIDGEDFKNQPPSDCNFPSEFVREMGFEFGEYTKSQETVQPKKTFANERTSQESDLKTENASEDLFLDSLRESEIKEKSETVHAMEYEAAEKEKNQTKLKTDSKCAGDDFDIEIDELLSASLTSNNSKSEPKASNSTDFSNIPDDPKHKKEEKSDDSKLDNLEDWLDSIL